MMKMQGVVCLRWVFVVCFLAVMCCPSSVGAHQRSEKKSFALYGDPALGSLHRESREAHGEKVRVLRQAQPAPGVKTYSADETQSLLDAHLQYRRNVTPSAADMNKIGWNIELANLARGWAEGCQFAHGQPSEPQSFGGVVAQNIWMGTYTFGLTRAVQAWYDENKDYDYNTATCTSDRECGHYRVMVYGNLQEIGCGSAICGNDMLTVCNYGPSVHVKGVPFKAGPSCARCSSGHGWCDNKLCNQDCTGGGAGCDCKLKCRNCGVLDSSTCECGCKAGFGGTDCFEKCVDTKPYCTYYNKQACNDDPQSKMDCPATCEMCAMLEENTPSGDKCCDGKQCSDNKVLDEKSCTCVAYLTDSPGAASLAVVGANWICFMAMMPSLITKLYSR